MTRQTVTASIQPRDRLSMTLFLAATIHGILILGLGFKVLSDRLLQTPPTLNVALVQIQSTQPPRQANYLAQRNQLASGLAKRRGQPGSAFYAPNPSRQSGSAPFTVHSTPPSIQAIHSYPPVLTQHESPYAVPNPHQPPRPAIPPHLQSPQPIDLNLEQAKLTAEIRQAIHNYNKRPRRLYLDTLNAKSSIEAGYLARWVRQVERIGNLNYPQAIAQHHLHGNLVLNVLINQQGQVLRTWIAKSSGSPILDQAAIRIVHLAAPFSPFPSAMRKHDNQILITRTWMFESDDLLKTR